MPVNIKRTAGILGNYLPFTIQLNGETVGKLKSNQEKEILLKQPFNYLTIKAPMTKSETIKVKSGDYVQILDHKWQLGIIWAFFILLILFPIFSIELTLPFLSFSLFIILLIGVSVVIFQHFKPYYKLIISTREFEQEVNDTNK